MPAMPSVEQPLSSVPTIHLKSGLSFPSENTESILDAAVRAGIALEHSCRTGRCGSCRAQATGGDLVVRLAETGLSQADRAAGWILTCARSANADVLLDARVLDAMLPAPRITPAKIDAVEHLTADIAFARLRLPPATPLPHLAGQYVDVVLPGGVKRSYSIANLPVNGQSSRLDLLIRRVDGGEMSRYWFEQAKPGDLLRVHGPRGTFFLRSPVPRQVLMLATGTGIAPIKAMLAQLADLPADQRPERLVVLWGNRLASDFVWSDEMLAAAPGWSMVRVLSGPDSAWRGTRGRITNHFDDLAMDLADTAVYACGSPNMIEDARALLTARGLPDERFLSDAFVSSLSVDADRTSRT